MLNSEDLEKYNKLFREEKDSSITFIGDKLDVVIPAYYIQKKISFFLGRSLETMGIFDCYYYNPDETEIKNIFDAFKDNDMTSYNKKKIGRITMKLPAVISLNPSNITETNFNVIDEELGVDKVQKYYILEFVKGDTFIKTVNVMELLSTLKKYVDLLFGGFIPETMNYEEILNTWILCNNINGAGDLGVSNSILAMIVSEIVRDKDKLGRPYRLKLKNMSLDDKKFKGKLVRILDLAKNISPFAALTSGDAKHGITISVTNEKRGEKSSKNISPIERSIS